MSRITEYTAVDRFDTGDVLIKDGTNGTKTITAANAARDFGNMLGAYTRRNIYGGRVFNGVPTSEQLAAIHAGTFDNLYPGDVFRVNGHDYVIADLDYYKGRYDSLTAEGSTATDMHHLVMIAKSVTPSAARMNPTNDTTGGYVNSEMYTTTLPTIQEQIEEDFGSLVMTHRQRFSNAVTDGIPTNDAWYDCKVNLMNEVNFYGCYHHSPSPAGVINHDHLTIDREQFALLKLNPNYFGRISIWLRDVVSASYFANAYGHAAATYYYAGTDTIAVRPVFLLGN